MTGPNPDVMAMLDAMAKGNGSSATGLLIPDLEPDIDILGAALAYARCGWYVGPLNMRSAQPKSPGSVLGRRWQDKTSRDPRVIASWFAGTMAGDVGLFLHVGRSGGVVVDIDHSDQLPNLLAEATAMAPFQQTRPDSDLGRGHAIFACPPGRSIGNSTGALGHGWGEIRGRNGVIVVFPTPHPEGGTYRWLRPGPVPVLPATVADQLPDASDATDAATDAEVRGFLDAHTEANHPNLLSAMVGRFNAKVTAGASRHETALECACWAMREAAAGCYPAGRAANELGQHFLDATARSDLGSGAVRDETTARDEFRGILAWAVAQAQLSDPGEVRAGVEDRTVVDLESLVPEEETASAPPAGKRRRAHTRSFAEIEPEEVHWLWDGRLPQGKLVTLDGDPDMGKSTLMVDIAARLSTGRPMPEAGGLGPPMASLIMSAEDGPGDTIRPRLDAAGADIDRVHFLDGIGDDEPEFPNLATDLPELEASVRDLGAVLVVIDVLMSYLPANVDSWKDQHVRRVLAPLSRMADRTKACIVLLRHFTKDTSASALHRGGGSVGIVGAARSGLIAAPDPDDESGDRRVLAVAKHNLAAPASSLGYEFVLDPARAVVRIEWQGTSPYSADELVAKAKRSHRAEEAGDVVGTDVLSVLHEAEMALSMTELCQRIGRDRRVIKAAADRLVARGFLLTTRIRRKRGDGSMGQPLAGYAINPEGPAGDGSLR